ncbi:hypothetical protein XENOCAPTIV_007532 [Xenoophorus captivus]|uniref:Uncharacterized protein n=2 Tax=Goodeidae TaxID=28758 RepID=A0ABV0Q8L3_9TELE
MIHSALALRHVSSVWIYRSGFQTGHMLTPQCYDPSLHRLMSFKHLQQLDATARLIQRRQNGSPLTLVLDLIAECVDLSGIISTAVIADDLATLPLVKFDFSCNKVSTIPVCYRKMRQLQSLQLENNPLQSPPAQICIKGKVHIFKYLSIEACRSEKMPDSLYLPVMERLSFTRPSTGSVEDMEQQKKQDSDSGVGSDNGDKRLSATEPSDEDSLSLNVPMSNITEEEGISKDDSSEHISSLTADPNSDSVRLIEGSPTEALNDPLSYRDSALNTRFINYIKGRTAAEFEEPLRIEEDSHWQTEQT